jgi:hypothetical protein
LLLQLEELRVVIDPGGEAEGVFVHCGNVHRRRPG